MAKTAILEQEPFLAPGQFWCEKNNQRLDIYQCVNRQNNIEKLNRNSRLYQSLKSCMNCLQGRKNRVRLEKRSQEKKKYICVKCGKEQNERLKLGFCTACYSKDYKKRQKTEIENLRKKVSEMSEKLKDKEYELTLDFKDHPALLKQIQDLSKREFRGPAGQAMWILREYFGPVEKKNE